MVSTDFKNIEAAEHRLNELKISAINKKLIITFKEQLAAENMSIGRQAKYIYTLGRIAQYIELDNFRKANKQDIVKLVAKINNNSDFKDWTKYNYLVIIRRFYKWIRIDEKINPLKDKIQRLQEKRDKTKNEKQKEIINLEIKKLEERIDSVSDEYPYEVKWIKPRIKQHKKTMPKELLSFDDVKKMANATHNLRDRCFILLLYETGARIGEILGVKLNDIEKDKYGCKIGLQGKTGYRKIRVISAAPAISNWLSQHPDRENEENLLFCGIGNFKRGAKLEYANFRKILRKTAKKINLKKPVNPHHFRHSRATDLAKKLTEAQLCQYMGWKIGSKEAATYVHLSGRDLDTKMLSLHGYKEEEKIEDQMKPIICPRCKTKNDAASKFCMECSLGLDEKSMIEYDKQKENIVNQGYNALFEKLQNLEKEFQEYKNKIKK